MSSAVRTNEFGARFDLFSDPGDDLGRRFIVRGSFIVSILVVGFLTTFRQVASRRLVDNQANDRCPRFRPGWGETEVHAAEVAGRVNIDALAHVAVLDIGRR